MTTRRSFLSAAAALAACTATAPAARSQPRQTIDVRKVGASGGGKASDLPHLRRAIELAGEQRGGATIYFPPGEYFLGAVDPEDLLIAKNLENVRFVGERAT